MTTTARIIAMLVKDFKVDPDRLSPAARLEDIGIDSIGVAELLFNIEDEFHLKLPDVPLDLATFGDVVRYVDEQIGAQCTPPAADPASAPNVWAVP
jgi:acyl carrier protein